MEAAKTQERMGLLPDDVLALPKVEVFVNGVEGYCLHDDEKQVVFFVFEEGVSIPDHAHCAQRGLVVSGEMVLEIDGKSSLYLPGDVYHVPVGMNHRTHFSKRTVVIDMSDAPDRYQVSNGA